MKFKIYKEKFSKKFKQKLKEFKFYLMKIVN